MLSGVYVYAHDAVDITTTGLVGDLMPTKCLFEEEKNGKSVLTMSLQYDKWGKWKAVKNGNYIKAMVPVRVPPKIVNNKYAERVATYQVKKGLSKDVTLYTSCGVADKTYPNPESFRLNYTIDSTAIVKPVKVKRYLKAGSEVQVLEEKSDGRCKVYNKAYGTGWTFMDNLELVKTSTIKQRLDGVEAVSDTVKFQYQLFQVEHVEQTLRGMNVTANHVFYELAKNFTNYENAADMEAFVTINGVMENMVTPDARFTILTDCEDSAGAVDYRQTNVAQAFLDPENGICAKYGLSLIRDNYDAYALKDVGTDRGFVVEYARNMLGVECNEDITETITRLVPYGSDKNGNPVYLDSMYINSEYIDDYAFPRIAYLDCSDSATESDTMTLAQVKAELKRRAEEEFANGIDKPKLSMTVQFIPLGDTEEYKQYRDLDKVFLFDRITIKDSVRMYDYSAEVVGMVYNVLTRRMESCTIGSLQKSSGVRKVAVWQVPTIDGGNIRLKSLHAGAFADGSIPTAALKDGAVTVDKIAAGALSADLIEAGSITTDKLAAGSVTADKIASGTIAAIGIDAGSITTDKLAAGAVTADKIAAGTIEAIGISAGSITTDKLAAGAVTADKIKTGTITADSGIIANGAIGTTQIADGSITDAKIVTLTASKITSGTIDAAEVNVVNLRADNITTGTINGKVIPELGSDKIKDGAISGVKIVNGAVVADKIAEGAVTAAKIVSSAVTTDKLAANAVTANKILAGAITTDKLDANAVTAEKIKANTITANKLASDVGSSLDLSSNKAITALVRDVGTIATTFVQYETPTGVKVGDLWVNTGVSVWADLKGSTWQKIGQQKWGAYLNSTPVTRVWDGSKWQILADQAVVNEQYTLIQQNTDKIGLMATKTELSSVEKRVSTAEEKITPAAITSTVTSSTQYKNDLAGKASTGDLSALESRVSTAENKITSDAITNTVTSSTKYKNDLAGKASTVDVNDLESRVSTAESKITPSAITNTVRSSTQYQNDLGSKVNQTVFDQTTTSITAQIQTVDKKASATPTKVTNTALTLDSNGIDMQGGQINIRAGSALTVDAPNFNLDASGNAVMKNASVSGNLTNNGIAVLTAKNLVVSSTQPTSPAPGMVWVKPVGSVAATFLYNNTSVQSFKNFETAHTLTNAGTATTASGSYTYNVKIPYKVTGNVSATRYLTMMVGNTAIFTDVALEKTAGTYVLDLSGNLSAWLGNASSLSFTLNLHYKTGDDGTLHNVHRVDVGAIDLKLYAKTNASSGWSSTEVQVYNG